MRMLSPDGTPLERRYFCSEEEKEIEKGKFVVVTDDELEAVEPRKSRDIDLRLFVDRDTIDPMYFERAYFLTPSGESTKAYRLLAEVMEKTGQAGIATFVMRAKEYLVAILADRGILRAETLHFADEVRSAADVGLAKAKKPNAAKVKRFESAIAKHTSKLKLDEFVDDYEERLRSLAEKKEKKHKDVVEAPEPEEQEEQGGEVIDLLEMLNRSLGGKATAGRKTRARASTSPKKSSKAASKKTRARPKSATRKRKRTA